MIARIWRGTVRTADADEYAAYIGATGLAEYMETQGNRGAWMLRREVGDLTEFLTLTFWDSLEDVKAFAGQDYERAVYYPEDDRFLVDRAETCPHYQVTTGEAGRR
jgi:heme-degrading monooxygenase HmoA